MLYNILIGRLAQLVRALRLHRRCQGFESLSDHMRQKMVVISLVVLLLGSIYVHCLPKQFADYPRKQVRINSHQITLILADTEQRKITGLSGSKPLKDNEGMLFQFPTPGHYGFWMKDMNYSLDFIYLLKNKVVEVRSTVSPNTYPNVLFSAKPFDAMIEVKAGTAHKIRVQIADEVIYN